MLRARALIIQAKEKIKLVFKFLGILLLVYLYVIYHHAWQLLLALDIHTHSSSR